MYKDKKTTTEVASVENYAMTQAGQEEKTFAVLQRKAMMFASSTIVPKAYQGANNVGNCVIALEMAHRMGALPLMVMQNLYVVNGNPTFSSKFLIASINTSKRFSPLRYEFRGEEGKQDYGCRCYAYEAKDNDHKEPLYGDWITMEMADKEGWTKKPGSKWLSMPNQMLRYRAAAFWQRAYCPEISMGLMTAEEAEDIEYAQIVSEPTSAEPAPTEAEPKDISQMLDEMQKQPAVDPETGELFPNM